MATLKRNPNELKPIIEVCLDSPSSNDVLIIDGNIKVDTLYLWGKENIPFYIISLGSDDFPVSKEELEKIEKEFEGYSVLVVACAVQVNELKISNNYKTFIINIGSSIRPPNQEDLDWFISKIKTKVQGYDWVFNKFIIGIGR